jgi:hypothetical protein
MCLTGAYQWRLVGPPYHNIGAPNSGGRGFQAVTSPPNQNLKKHTHTHTDFVGIMISKVLHDLCFCLNQLLKLGDD